MSLFGEKCVRCGEKTRDEYRGQPTCNPCRDEIEVAFAESNEAHRNCPVDGATLAKELAHGVIIDRCPTCRGVWLDPGELEGVSTEVSEQVWKAMAFTRTMG
jgi:hypothetical protein